MNLQLLNSPLVSQVTLWMTTAYINASRESDGGGFFQRYALQSGWD